MSCQHLHESLVFVPSHVPLISPGQMSVEGGGVELREHKDFSNIAVDTVADRDIDQAVVSPEWHSWLSTLLGERVQTAPSSTS